MWLLKQKHETSEIICAILIPLRSLKISPIKCVSVEKYDDTGAYVEFNSGYCRHNHIKTAIKKMF